MIQNQTLQLNEAMQTVESGFVIQNHGLHVSRELTEREWTELGRYLVKRMEGSAWALGDWLIYGGRQLEWKAKLGQGSYETASQITGYTVGYLRHLLMVAKAYGQPLRDLGLSWSMYRLAMMRPEPEREFLLQQAKTQGWTYNDMVAHVAKVGGKGHQITSGRSRHHHTQVRCPECKHVFTVKGNKVQ